MSASLVEIFLSHILYVLVLLPKLRCFGTDTEKGQTIVSEANIIKELRNTVIISSLVSHPTSDLWCGGSWKQKT